MSELIDKLKVVAICNKAIYASFDALTRGMLMGVRDTIAELPPEQPEIIRCRDCKHWREDHTCREHSLVSPMMAYEFCSRAERREEGE